MSSEIERQDGGGGARPAAPAAVHIGDHAPGPDDAPDEPEDAPDRTEWELAVHAAIVAVATALEVAPAARAVVVVMDPGDEAYVRGRVGEMSGDAGRVTVRIQVQHVLVASTPHPCVVVSIAGSGE